LAKIKRLIKNNKNKKIKGQARRTAPTLSLFVNDEIFRDKSLEINL
jgi:hypothetical protein